VFNPSLGFLDELGVDAKNPERNQFVRIQIPQFRFFISARNHVTSKIAIANILSGSTLTEGAHRSGVLPIGKK